MKVLEVIRQGQIGGGESHLLDLISFFDRDIVEPVCLAFTNGEMIRHLNQMGVCCHVIDTQKPFDINVQKQVMQLIIDEGIQIVHAHGSRAASNVLYPAKKLQKPLIYTVHGWSFHDDQSWLVKKLRGLSEKLICHYAKQVICVSQSNLDTGKAVFGLKSAIVIENGVNLERFNPDAKFKDLRSEFGFSPSDFVVGFIARCTKQKNPIIFLESIRISHQRNPNIKALFVGEGEMEEEVDDFIRQHQMENYVYRSKFRLDVPDLLNSIDVYCLPSLWEGLSIALLEAMAMSKPIIVTPTDGTKELITNKKDGLIVPFNDSVNISSAIELFLKDYNLRASCGISARMFVSERFDAKRVSDSVTDLYKMIV